MPSKFREKEYNISDLDWVAVAGKIGESVEDKKWGGKEQTTSRGAEQVHQHQVIPIRI